MNCEVKSHLYRCRVFVLFYRKDTDVPGWPARVLRDVGLLRFTLANSSTRLLAPTTALNQVFFGGF